MRTLFGNDCWRDTKQVHKMGHIKIVQSGTMLEVYEYEKHANTHKKIIRKRRKSHEPEAPFANYRSRASCKRAKKNFYRLVASNMERKESVAFITLTTLRAQISLDLGYIYVRQFIANLRKKYGEGIVLIAVPEYQPRSGHLHFHCIVWGIPEETLTEERDRRILQPCWARGYLDVCLIRNKSYRVASYMAKYLAKTFEDKRVGKRRAYTSTHNVKRPISLTSQTFSGFINDFLSPDHSVTFQASYETMYLGRCDYKIYSKTVQNV